jgi:hypothetical protein
MRRGRANDPQFVAEPPEAERNPSDCRSVPHEIQPRMRVSAQRENPRELDENLLVAKVGRPFFQLLKARLRGCALCGREAPVVPQEACQDHIEILTPGVRPVDRRWQVR